MEAMWLLSAWNVDGPDWDILFFFLRYSVNVNYTPDLEGWVLKSIIVVINIFIINIFYVDYMLQ